MRPQPNIPTPSVSSLKRISPNPPAPPNRPSLVLLATIPPIAQVHSHQPFKPIQTNSNQFKPVQTCSNQIKVKKFPRTPKSDQFQDTPNIKTAPTFMLPPPGERRRDSAQLIWDSISFRWLVIRSRYGWCSGSERVGSLLKRDWAAVLAARIQACRQEGAQFQGREAALRRAQNVAGAAEAEVGFGDFEAVGGFGQGVQFFEAAGSVASEMRMHQDLWAPRPMRPRN